MEVILKKYFWLINLSGLAVAGFLFGTAINDYLVSEVLRAPDQAFALPDTAAGSVQLDSFGPENIADTFISRRPFDSDPPEPEEPEVVVNNESESEAKDESEEGDGIEESDLDVALIGTLVYPDPGMSMATVKLSGESKLVRVGTVLEEKAKILAIERRFLIVDEDGEKKYIRLWEQDKGGDAKKKPAAGRNNRKLPNEKPAATSKKKTPNWKEGVTKVSDTEYEISRGMLDEQLEDLSQLGMQARIVPNYRNGKYEGFKLVGVRPNSLYRSIGIRSGDIVKRINGTEINSPNKAIELFEQFKNSNAIQLDVERRGQQKSFNYNVK